MVPKNGEFLGVAFRGVQRTGTGTGKKGLGLAPAVDMDRARSKVEANFGKKPFRYDLDWERVRRLCTGSMFV